MGRRGDKLTAECTALAEELVPRLEALGAVKTRKMFGGYGLFGDGKMFGLVTSDVELFLKVDESNVDRFRSARSPQHGTMPYFRVPKGVLSNDEELLDWAGSAVEVAHG